MPLVRPELKNRLEVVKWVSWETCPPISKASHQCKIC